MDKKLVMLLLIDAFRLDYFERTDYIANLAKRSVTGALREPFGFLPRAAYFAGLTPEEFGFSNMYCYDPNNTPFGIARGIQVSNETHAEYNRQARKKIVEFSQQYTTSYGASYISTLDIPIPFLPYFDIAEKYAPWEAEKGYYSLFDILDEYNLPWFQCSWPLTKLLPRKDDTAIVGEVVNSLEPEHRFAYVHLSELDRTGHSFGPGSPEIQRVLDQTDRLVRAIIEHCESLYDEFSLIMFGDHGMVNVVHTLNLWRYLQKTGLVFGRDYVCFLDSTMARFWFHTSQAQQSITELLSGLDEGYILTETIRHSHAIADCDPRNGELYFLVKPGVIIFPNFFQMSGHPVKGMHGYAPDIEDNQGFFLIYNAKQGFKGNCGIVNASQIFPTSLSLLGFEPTRFTKKISVLEQQVIDVKKSKYTQQTDPTVDTVIEEHLQTICDTITELLPEAEAIILTGGFGRGEGGVFWQNGQVIPVNDYDIIIVSDCEKKIDFRTVRQDLAQKIGVDYVDLTVYSSNLAKYKISQLNFDIKYGSQVLQGNPLILERFPQYAAVEIPLMDGVKLLLNRIAGLLTSEFEPDITNSFTELKARYYFINQIVKALVAVGDCYLLNWSAYDVSYIRRARRFASLGELSGLPNHLINLIHQAYLFKGKPDYENLDDIWDLFFLATDALKLALIRFVNEITSLNSNDILITTKNTYDHFKDNLTNFPSDNRLCASRLSSISLHSEFGDEQIHQISIRYSLDAALVLLLFSLEQEYKINLQYLHGAVGWLDHVIRIPETINSSDELHYWNELRLLFVSVWEEIRGRPSKY